MRVYNHDFNYTIKISLTLSYTKNVVFKEKLSTLECFQCNMITVSMASCIARSNALRSIPQDSDVLMV